MTEQETKQLQDTLEDRFPGAITRDERQGYEGYIVEAAKLVEIAKSLRDEMGYDYLSSVTGVDYLPDEKMEVVYHLYRSTGGAALTLKVQTPRDDSVVPSLVSIYPGADFQEREAWDLLGIRFEGHPDLRRILLWDGFHGHPLRKDWKEPFFEMDGKPFKSRWPQGDIQQAEDTNPFGKNVHYPSEFTPEGWTPEGKLRSIRVLVRSNKETVTKIEVLRPITSLLTSVRNTHQHTGSSAWL